MWPSATLQNYRKRLSIISMVLVTRLLANVLYEDCLGLFHELRFSLKGSSRFLESQDAVENGGILLAFPRTGVSVESPSLSELILGKGI